MRKESAWKILERLKFSPVEFLVHVARGEICALGLLGKKSVRKNLEELRLQLLPVSVRVQAARELLQYMHPKIASTAMTENPDGMEKELVQVYIPDNSRSGKKCSQK